MNSVQKSPRQQREDRALNRVLCWFGGAVVLEFLILLLNRFYVEFDVDGTQLAYGIGQFLKIMIWVALVAVVALAALTVVRRRQGKPLLMCVVALVFSASVLACAVVATVWQAAGVQFLYVAVPVVTVLALVYYLYQREFFLVALMGGGGMTALWGYRKLGVESFNGKLLMLVVAVLLVAIGVALLFLRRSDGRIHLGGKAFALLPRRATYPALFITCAAVVLSLAVTVVLGTQAAFYLLFFLVGWLFIMAVYYTVRLM